ncbi:hypothetical protein Ciccas_011982 [Cichlidogyrus casuarinus]|uniref:Uncharacterized protein n=1 Tax=Cichlidogyrus casuarinus TaxID=1844966 RepID=A0ABD2PRE9_9PLAT
MVSHCRIDCLIREELIYLGEGKIVQINWEEPEELLGTLKNYIVTVSNGYVTQVEGNVIVLKNMDGQPFKHKYDYVIRITAVYNQGTQRKILLITFKFEEKVYSQEFMDNMAQTIAKKLDASMEIRQRNFSEELAEISKPWSYNVEKLVLVISNDVRAFDGKEGLKDSSFQSEEPCEFIHDSEIKCRSVILKKGTEKNDLYTWPEDDASDRGMSAQLRFYYGEETDHWYATKISSNLSCRLVDKASKTLL